MKTIKRYLLVLFAALLWTGCEKEEDSFVIIDSVSALGDEFFFNQKVKVWTVVKTNNLADAYYTWSCNGGKLTQPQGLDENTWQAPKEPGVYTVTCTVDVNGVKQTRSRDMYVSVYYLEKVERNFLHTLGSANSSMTIVQDSVTKISHVETFVNVTSAVRGYVQHGFGDRELHVPFSTKAQVGWITKTGVKNTFPLRDIKIGTAVSENTILYEWSLNRAPEPLDQTYAENVRFEWYPVGRSTGLPVHAGTGTPYNGLLQLTVRNLGTNTLTLYSFPVNTTALSFTANQLKDVAMSIDADYMFHLSVGGTEIFTSDGIKQWRINNGSQDDIYINEWRINYVSNVNNATNAPPYIYIDNLIGVNDGTVLQ